MPRRAPVAAPRLIALLRGINVGKAKRVAMADLRDLLERAGFFDVRTLLQSGNVVLSASGSTASLTAKMERAFETTLGFSSRFTVLPATELDAIIADNPLPIAVTEPSRFLVGVLADASVRERLTPLEASDWGDERIALGERVAYVWCPRGQAESPLSEAVARAARDRITTRNWATLTKLQALANARA